MNQGKADFDQIRDAMADLQTNLAAQRTQAAGTLRDAASVLQATLIVIAVALLATVLVLAFGLWRSAILPLRRLAADARQVAEGDFEHQVEPGGPAEMRAVGLDVNRMRERILAELSAVQAAHASLEARTEDLQRSNSELEQFAYVASHDLQEPLRKVASFCQLLQRRYAGQLDAKADEYIEHAVDGAKRMQALINDLLAFSRVGRTGQRLEPVSCAVLLAQAWANLAADGAAHARDHRGGRAAGGAWRGLPADRRVPEPDRQRAEVPRGRAAPGHGLDPQGRGFLAVLVQRQWNRHRAGIRRADIRDFPAAARQGDLSRHRNRPGHGKEDHRVSRWPDLARHDDHGRGPFLVYPASAPGGRACTATDGGSTKVIDVLLVEDDPGDVLMTREAFEHHKIRNQLHVVNDGEQALQFLHQTGEYASAPRPGLILLDLNLPRRDGLEVLAELKEDPRLRVIPVVILTTSQAEEDILRSYALHANAYVSKPVDFERFMEVIQQIDTFFITVVELPR